MGGPSRPRDPRPLGWSRACSARRTCSWRGRQRCGWSRRSGFNWRQQHVWLGRKGYRAHAPPGPRQAASRGLPVAKKSSALRASSVPGTTTPAVAPSLATSVESASVPFVVWRVRGRGGGRGRTHAAVFSQPVQSGNSLARKRRRVTGRTSPPSSAIPPPGCPLSDRCLFEVT